MALLITKGTGLLLMANYIGESPGVLASRYPLSGGFVEEVLGPMRSATPKLVIVPSSVDGDVTYTLTVGDVSRTFVVTPVDPASALITTDLPDVFVFDGETDYEASVPEEGLESVEWVLDNTALVGGLETDRVIRFRIENNQYVRLQATVTNLLGVREQSSKTFNPGQAPNYGGYVHNTYPDHYDVHLFVYGTMPIHYAWEVSEWVPAGYWGAWQPCGTDSENLSTTRPVYGSRKRLRARTWNPIGSIYVPWSGEIEVPAQDPPP